MAYREMAKLHELVARTGAADALATLMGTDATSYDRGELKKLFADAGVNDPTDLINDFVSEQLLEYRGRGIALSSQGERTALLVEALNGGDIEDIFQRLRALGSITSRYELVRHGMTTLFVKSLAERPDFRRLYICSPWIHPSEQEVAYLRHACIKAEDGCGSQPELYVIARPTDRMPADAEDGLLDFRELGARIFLHPRVHTKLYIREPHVRGTTLMAIIGSQNLTRSQNLELGIKINGDSSLIGQLIRYFYDLMSWSQEQE